MSGNHGYIETRSAVNTFQGCSVDDSSSSQESGAPEASAKGSYASSAVLIGVYDIY